MQKTGIVLLILGIVIFMGFGGKGFLEFLLSPEGSLLIKVGVFSIAGGALLIILASLKENWGKKDKYEGVEK